MDAEHTLMRKLARTDKAAAASYIGLSNRSLCVDSPVCEKHSWLDIIDDKTAG
jgi:hypothetical protein